MNVDVAALTRPQFFFVRASSGGQVLLRRTGPPEAGKQLRQGRKIPSHKGAIYKSPGLQTGANIMIRRQAPTVRDQIRRRFTCDYIFRPFGAERMVDFKYPELLAVSPRWLGAIDFRTFGARVLCKRIRAGTTIFVNKLTGFVSKR